MTRKEISERTGFDNGDFFTSEQQVHDYFDREQLASLVSSKQIADELPTQDELDDMAEMVIANRWHMMPDCADARPWVPEDTNPNAR